MNTLGDYLKSYREINDLTTRELGDRFDITPSYVTQIEHGKRMPSKNKLFQIMSYFANEIGDFGIGEIPREEIIKEYTSNKKAPFEAVLKEYFEYEDTRKKEKFEILNGLNKDGEKLHNKQVKLYKKESRIEIIEAPYFNLAWLLTQDDFEVFFLDDFNNVTEQRIDGEIPIFNSIYASVLSETDKKMIYNVLKEIFEHRFKERQRPLEKTHKNYNKED